MKKKCCSKEMRNERETRKKNRLEVAVIISMMGETSTRSFTLTSTHYINRLFYVYGRLQGRR
jgi:hypothetical protein